MRLLGAAALLRNLPLLHGHYYRIVAVATNGVGVTSAIDAEPANGGACPLLISGQTVLHCDEVGGRISIFLGMNTIRSVLVTGVVGGGAKERKKRKA